MRPRTWPLKSMSGGAPPLVVTGGIGGVMSIPFWLGWLSIPIRYLAGTARDRAFLDLLGGCFIIWFAVSDYCHDHDHHYHIHPNSKVGNPAESLQSPNLP